MGLVSSRIELMLEAKEKGVSFDSMLTLGRQKIVISKRKFKKIIKNYNLDANIKNPNINHRLHADNQ